MCASMLIPSIIFNRFMEEESAKEEKLNFLQEIVRIPQTFRCPITHQIMETPVTLPDGQTYESTAITRWLRISNKSPVTGLPIGDRRLLRNYALQNAISDHQSKLQKIKENSHRFFSPKKGARLAKFIKSQICQYNQRRYDEQEYEDGFYAGQYFRNQFHGRGVYIWVGQPLYTYEGEWKKGVRTGKGKLTETVGQIQTQYYEGDFDNNRFHGKGKHVIQGKYTFEGTWRENQRVKGTCQFSNGVVYTGEYKDDVEDGIGKSVHPNGEVYEGEFKQGMYHGKGKQIIGQGPNQGDSYEGTFVRGLKNAYGRYAFKNGDIYYGVLHNGEFEGDGRYYFGSGDQLLGTWKRGVITGPCKLVFSNGSTELVDAIDGRIVERKPLLGFLSIFYN